MSLTDSDRWQHEFFTVLAARKLISRNGKIKAAVMEGTRAPLVEQASTKVRLFATIKEAEAHLRSRRKALLAAGFNQDSGTLGRGVLVFSKTGAATVILALDKRR